MTSIDKKIGKLEPGRTEKNEYAFRLPTRIGIYGSSGTGKTHWLVRYLCEKKYGLGQFDQIIWVTPPGSFAQGKLKLMQQTWKEFYKPVEGLDEAKIEELIAEGESQKWVTLVVFDDLMLDTGKSKYVQRLFISGRHRGVSVCELRQQIFSGPRTSRLQMEYYVLFRNGAQRDEAKRLFAQITSNARDRDLMMAAYRGITERPGGHGCLIIDTKSAESEGLRARDTDMDVVIPQLAHV
jgi:hypothetical protein